MNIEQTTGDGDKCCSFSRDCADHETVTDSAFTVSFDARMFSRTKLSLFYFPTQPFIFVVVGLRCIACNLTTEPEIHVRPFTNHET